MIELEFMRYEDETGDFDVKMEELEKPITQESLFSTENGLNKMIEPQFIKIENEMSDTEVKIEVKKEPEILEDSFSTENSSKTYLKNNKIIEPEFIKFENELATNFEVKNEVVDESILQGLSSNENRVKKYFENNTMFKPKFIKFEDEITDFKVQIEVMEIPKIQKDLSSTANDSKKDLNVEEIIREEHSYSTLYFEEENSRKNLYIDAYKDYLVDNNLDKPDIQLEPEKFQLESEFICDLCGKDCITSLQLANHECTDTGAPNKWTNDTKYLYTCNFCKMKFQYPEAILKFGINFKLYYCTYCRSRIEQKTKPNEQVNITEEQVSIARSRRGRPKLKCSTCEKVFGTSYDLRRHRTIHNKKDTFSKPCKVIRKTFDLNVLNRSKILQVPKSAYSNELPYTDTKSETVIGFP